MCTGSKVYSMILLIMAEHYNYKQYTKVKIVTLIVQCYLIK